MNNKKTTIAGFLLIGSGLLGLAAAFMGLGDQSVAMASIMTGIAGTGLLAAQDGGF